jgi:hypothetical protein
VSAFVTLSRNPISLSLRRFKADKCGGKRARFLRADATATASGNSQTHCQCGYLFVFRQISKEMQYKGIEKGAIGQYT